MKWILIVKIIISIITFKLLKKKSFKIIIIVIEFLIPYEKGVLGLSGICPDNVRSFHVSAQFLDICNVRNLSHSGTFSGQFWHARTFLMMFSGHSFFIGITRGSSKQPDDSFVPRLLSKPARNSCDLQVLFLELFYWKCKNQSESILYNGS